MKWALSFGLVLAFVMESHSVANAKANRMGIGTTTCSDVMTWQPATDPRGEIIVSWADGYMTGYNDNAPWDYQRDLAAMSTRQQVAYLLDYCEKNPSKLFGDGVDELYNNLPMPNKHNP